MSVFISYCHQDQDFANSLHELVAFALDGISECYIDKDGYNRPGHDYGSDWFDSICSAMDESEVFIQVYSKSSFESKFFIFEYGYIMSEKRNNKKVLPMSLFTDPYDAPSFIEKKQAAVINGISRFGEADWIAWLKNFYSKSISRSELDDRLYKFSYDNQLKNTFKEKINNINESIDKIELSYQNGSAGISEFRYQLSDQIDQISKMDIPRVARIVFGEWLRGESERVEASIKNKGLSLPSDEYPFILREILSYRDISVSAVAIMDDQESFWKTNIGSEIRDRSNDNKNNKRIFVLKDISSLNDNINEIEKHAQKYHVKIISYEQATDEINFVNDFSIHSIEDRILGMARYSLEDGGQIIFSWNQKEIDSSYERFSRLWEISVEVSANKDANADLAELVFSSDDEEMTGYIDKDKYHKYEEKHPHYVEMLELMIKKVDDHFDKVGITKTRKILEMGAGTGHLTKRLLKSKIRNISQVVAIEKDKNLVMFMRSRYSDPRLRIMRRDACLYDPPGFYDAIVSSFSDHHIMKNEEMSKRYIENIVMNMRRNSIYVCGDEFLPRHGNNIESRIDAIKKYHRYIIQVAESNRLIAERDGNIDEYNSIGELIELEREAMESGIRACTKDMSRQFGDYKVSYDMYKDRLARGGLEVVDEKRIGPESDDLAEEVGGIYVLVAKLAG